jgi:vancomycin permeability regulator SanA
MTHPMAGAWAAISLTSIVLAIAGGEAVFFGRPFGPQGLWHVAVALAFLVPLCSWGARFGLPRPTRTARLGATVLLGLAGLMAVRDAAVYYLLLGSGTIASAFPVPMSLLLLLPIAAALRELLRPPARGRLLIAAVPASAVGCLATFLALIATFGSTDYRREADCAVVLGAGVWDDGTPSLALSDRVAEGIRLYRDGLVGKLIMTGGTGRNGHSEPEVMRRIAVRAGVPAAAVLLDEAGSDTRRSAKSVRRIMDREGLRSALVVSHYYHLLRCRGIFAHAGVDCRTVPARMSRRLDGEPWYLLRECAAFVTYLEG